MHYVKMGSVSQMGMVRYSEVDSAVRGVAEALPVLQNLRRLVVNDVDGSSRAL